VPLLLGAGIRFFDNLATAPIELGGPTVYEGNGVTHLHYTVQAGRLAVRHKEGEHAIMDVYPSLTYRDVTAALSWVAAAFGLQPRIYDVDEGGAEQINHGALVHGEGLVLVESERPQDLHGSHTGRGWVYVYVADIDAHYQHALTAGAEVLGEPHAGPGGMHGYSARDLEGNLWSFGTARPTP